LELCILNLREAVTTLNRERQHRNNTENHRPKTGSASAEERSSDRPSGWRSQLDDPAVPTLTPALIPLTPIELATPSTWNYLGDLFSHYYKDHTSSSSKTRNAREDSQ
jgi:hypothetical protein